MYMNVLRKITVLNMYVHNTQQHKCIPVNTYKAFGQVLLLISILTESNLLWLSCHTLIIFENTHETAEFPQENKRNYPFIWLRTKGKHPSCAADRTKLYRIENIRRKSPDRQHARPAPTQYILVDPTYRWDRRGAADPSEPPLHQVMLHTINFCLQAL